jgi:hypothetical protein
VRFEKNERKQSISRQISSRNSYFHFLFRVEDIRFPFQSVFTGAVQFSAEDISILDTICCISCIPSSPETNCLKYTTSHIDPQKRVFVYAQNFSFCHCGRRWSCAVKWGERIVAHYQSMTTPRNYETCRSKFERSVHPNQLFLRTNFYLWKRFSMVEENILGALWISFWA